MEVSFFGGLSLGRVDEYSICQYTGVRVASLLDLAAQKVRVVQVRALYADFAPLITLKALSYFEDGDLSTLDDEVKRTLADAAAAVVTPTEIALLTDRLDQP